MIEKKHIVAGGISGRYKHIVDHIDRTLTSRNLDLEAGQKKSEEEVGLVVVV